MPEFKSARQAAAERDCGYSCQVCGCERPGDEAVEEFRSLVDDMMRLSRVIGTMSEQREAARRINIRSRKNAT